MKKQNAAHAPVIPAINNLVAKHAAKFNRHQVHRCRKREAKNGTRRHSGSGWE